MFAHDPEEVQLWLNALPQNFGLDMSETQQAVLQFLDNCIGRFSKAQYKYTDQLVELVNTVNTESSSRGDLCRTLIETSSNIGGSDYKHPFSPLLLTLCENVNFIKSDRRPAILYLTNLMTLLLSKQNVPYYLQSLCSSKLDSQVDRSDIYPRQSKQWTKNEMIFQARLCLGLEKMSAKSKEIDFASIEDEFTALIKTDIVEDALQAKKEFVQLLDKLPVDVLDSHLEKAALFCSRQLQWTSYEPLVNYITLRHPLAGAVFDYSEIKQMKSLVSMEQ